MPNSNEFFDFVGTPEQVARGVRPTRRIPTIRARPPTREIVNVQSRSTRRGTYSVGDYIEVNDGEYEGCRGVITAIRVTDDRYVELTACWDDDEEDLELWHDIEYIDMVRRKKKIKMEKNTKSNSMKELVKRMRKDDNRNLYFENLLSEMR